MQEAIKHKPVVRFIGTPRFFDYGEDKESPVAMVYTLDHPRLGSREVLTSLIVKRNEDGSFETLNTKYIPA